MKSTLVLKQSLLKRIEILGLMENEKDSEVTACLASAYAALVAKEMRLLRIDIGELDSFSDGQIAFKMNYYNEQDREEEIYKANNKMTTHND